MAKTKNSVREVVSPAREPLERRRAPRRVARIPAYVAMASDATRRLCMTHDMSRMGGMLMTHVNLKPGEAVKVELFFGGDATQPKVANAHVVRTRRRDQPNTYWTFDLAVQFDEPIDDADAEVEAIAEKQRGLWKDR